MAWIVRENPFNLTQEEMLNNANEEIAFLLSLGAVWTPEAICGMLGNQQHESNINPGAWESNLVGNLTVGFGLVQWTPASKYINWASQHGYDRLDPVGQMIWIDEETSATGQWIPTASYPLSWEDFKASTESPEYLAEAFLYNFERPLDPLATVQSRREASRYYYDNCTFEGGT